MKILSVSYALHFGSVKIHKHCLYCSVFLQSLIPTFQYFFNFIFIWSAICESHILVSFFWSVNCMSCVFESQNIYQRCFSITICRTINFYYLCLFRLFLWSVNCTVMVSKLCLISQTTLNLWEVLILEIFSSWDIKKGQFHF